MKKIVLNTIRIILIILTIFISIIVANRITIKEVESKKEQLSTGESNFIATEDHLAQTAEKDKKIEELTSTNTNNSTKIAELNSKITSLNTQVSTLTSQKSSLQTEYNNFRSKIATAITSKGVSTKSTATADEMANNINNISDGIDTLKFQVRCCTITNNPFIGLYSMDISGFNSMSISFYSGWGTPTYYIYVDGTAIYNSTTATTITRNIANNSNLQLKVYGTIDDAIGIFNVTLRK